MSYAGVLNAGAEVDKVRRLISLFSFPPPIIIIITISPHFSKTLFYAHVQWAGGVMGCGQAHRALMIDYTRSSKPKWSACLP